MRVTGSRVTISPSIFLGVRVYRSIAIVSVPNRAINVVLVIGTGRGIAVEPDEHPMTNGSAASAAGATMRAVAASMVIPRRVRMANAVW